MEIKALSKMISKVKVSPLTPFYLREHLGHTVRMREDTDAEEVSVKIWRLKDPEECRRFLFWFDCKECKAKVRLLLTKASMLTVQEALRRGIEDFTVTQIGVTQDHKPRTFLTPKDMLGQKIIAHPEGR